MGEFGGGRELILTHTNAGVDALRARLNRLGVPAPRFAIDTIAGWSLRLAASFPETSGLKNPQPRTNDDYRRVYPAAAELLKHSGVRQIVLASYSGVYVDEYQDCTTDQHEVVRGLSDILPCRIVGDSLQGIFGFGNNQLVDWDDHVLGVFEETPGPNTPWRWSESNPGLGEWINDYVRPQLLACERIDLTTAPSGVEWLEISSPGQGQVNQLAACRRRAENHAHTIVAIHALPTQCHAIARRLNGQFSCIEALDSRALYNAAHQIETTTGLARGARVIDFAAECMTTVSTELRTIRDGLAAGREPRVRKHAQQLRALISLHDDQWINRLSDALLAISEMPGATTFRREAWRDMQRAAASLAAADAASLVDALWLIRNRSRRWGRVLPRCAMGTTLLVKGLEFDHAVLLDADALNAKNLYVALTRGSRSVTILSRSRVIAPKSI